MPFQLIAPGKRKKRRGGKVYVNENIVLRGRIGTRQYELWTDTRDEDEARTIAAAFELDIRRGRVPGPGEEVTFAQATEFYIAAKKPSKGDARRIRRIAREIGGKLVGDVVHADFIAAADKLMSARSNEYKNRWVIKPGASILHYAADNKWRDWLRIKKLEEAEPETRASSAGVARALLGALWDAYEAAQAAHARHATKLTERSRRLAYKKWLLVLWLFKHGNRISDPLRLIWADDIFLARRAYRLFVAKGRRWREKPIDEEVFEALANDAWKDGRVFPWRTRSGVYKWLWPLVERLGVVFTPHRARHYLGKQLNAMGAGLKTIMGALDHRDAKSSLRYQDADMDIVRDAIGRVGKLVGDNRARRRKAR